MLGQAARSGLGLLLAALAAGLAAGQDPALLCACPGLVWTVKPQGNAITDRIHAANVKAMDLMSSRKGVELAIYGDSITQHMSEGENLPVFLKHWGKYKALSMGVGNDRVYNLFWRLRNGETPITPLKVAVFFIGTNDVGYTEECTRSQDGLLSAVPSIDSRIQHLLEWFVRTQPGTQIVLLGLLPRGAWSLPPPTEAWPNRLTPTLTAINANLQAMAKANPSTFHYLDCGAFAVRNGSAAVDTDLLPDALHPDAAGYDLLYTCMQPLVDQLMAAQNATRDDARPQTTAGDMPDTQGALTEALAESFSTNALPKLTMTEAAALIANATLQQQWSRLAVQRASAEAAGRPNPVAAAPAVAESLAHPRSPEEALRTRLVLESAPNAATPPQPNWQDILSIVDGLPTRPANASDPNDVCLRTPQTIAKERSAAAYSFQAMGVYGLQQDEADLPYMPEGAAQGQARPAQLRARPLLAGQSVQGET